MLKTGTKLSVIAIIVLLLRPESAIAKMCILPLENGKPTLPVEIKSPYRMATNPRVIAGLPLFVSAIQQSKTYTISGRKYIEHSGFPNNLLDEVYPLSNGNSIGIGWKPHQVYFFTKGSKSFTPIIGSNDYRQAYFDVHSKQLFLKKRNDSTTYNQKNGVLTISSFPDVQDKLKNFGFGMPRFVPEIDGYFSAVNEQIWFLKNGGRSWQKVPLKSQWDMRYDLNRAVISYDKATRIIRLYNGHKGRVYSLKFKGGRLKYINSTDKSSWKLHSKTASWLGWVGKSYFEIKAPSFFDFLSSKTKVAPPKLMILRQKTERAKTVNDVKARQQKTLRHVTFHARINTWNGEDTWFLKTQWGITVFNGTDFSEPEDLSYDIIGQTPYFSLVNNTKILQSEKGAFEILDGNLTIRLMCGLSELRESCQHLEIRYLKRMKKFYILDKFKNRSFISSDLRSFKRIKSSSKIKLFVAELPDRAAALLVGQDGLYTLENDCIN